ncbi:cord and cs domain protein [Moniliophthora roreri MCA 2997]|uniref:Cord and cs domain protein n=2 Tax=Moniliophthora roreri TaxID=221103 RepID=V2X163_MONRO|nr:cord and cs domain protein [Moniliophthora roreri MCA 2997]KAI3607870.1 cord and cs domain protein [Moniliophthora roreri]
MPRCTRKGCGKEFAEGDTEACIFHPGAPKFHEGLKSWTCCSGVNKPVLDFDEFMKIPGCAETDRHTHDSPQIESVDEGSKSTENATINEEQSATGTPEVQQTVPTPIARDPAPAAALPPPPPVVEEEDDPNIPVQPGTECRRRGCKTTFVSDDVNRKGDGEGTKCIYHPAPPIFREGSKGYLCCKRRVLEFDEFLKIEGCKTGRHVFASKTNLQSAAEELTTCRIDHYQTVDKVYVSVFAKKAEKDASKIEFEENRVTVDLRLPDHKRFVKTIELFGPIDPAASAYHFFGTKVELTLKKNDTRSWTILEKPVHDLGNISLTFGVAGRTGTIGAKESVLDEQNKHRA